MGGAVLTFAAQMHRFLSEETENGRASTRVAYPLLALFTAFTENEPGDLDNRSDVAFGKSRKAVRKILVSSWGGFTRKRSRRYHDRCRTR
jgi:hypothetical protein